MGSQKHERVIAELELKRQRLDHKATRERYQREREREQHEFRMLQWRVAQRAPGVASALTLPQDPGSLDFGLMGVADTTPDLSSSSLVPFPP
jgi:hypothetical protein